MFSHSFPLVCRHTFEISIKTFTLTTFYLPKLQWLTFTFPAWYWYWFCSVVIDSGGPCGREMGDDWRSALQRSGLASTQKTSAPAGSSTYSLNVNENVTRGLGGCYYLFNQFNHFKYLFYFFLSVEGPKIVSFITFAQWIQARLPFHLCSWNWQIAPPLPGNDGVCDPVTVLPSCECAHQFRSHLSGLGWKCNVFPQRGPF